MKFCQPVSMLTVPPGDEANWVTVSMGAQAPPFGIFWNTNLTVTEFMPTGRLFTGTWPLICQTTPIPLLTDCTEQVGLPKAGAAALASGGDREEPETAEKYQGQQTFRGSRQQ